MLHKFLEEGAWFLPKRYGFGAGLPIAWQGWALIAGYLSIVAGIAAMAQSANDATRITALGMLFFATAALAEIARRRTRGGWHWRWGERD